MQRNLCEWDPMNKYKSEPLDTTMGEASTQDSMWTFQKLFMWPLLPLGILADQVVWCVSITEVCSLYNTLLQRLNEHDENIGRECQGNGSSPPDVTSVEPLFKRLEGNKTSTLSLGIILDSWGIELSVWLEEKWLFCMSVSNCKQLSNLLCKEHDPLLWRRAIQSLKGVG